MGTQIRNAVQLIRALRDDQRGASAIEYALIAAAVAVVVAGFTTNLGNSVRTIFTTLQTSLSTAAGT